MLPAAEDVLRKMLPPNAYRRLDKSIFKANCIRSYSCSFFRLLGRGSLSGRIRVLLTRVSFKFPFLSAEVVNSFKNQEDVFHALRSSCHVPFRGCMMLIVWLRGCKLTIYLVAPHLSAVNNKVACFDFPAPVPETSCRSTQLGLQKGHHAWPSTLRIIGGFGPYCYDGHAYFDGMFWPQMLVPWKGPTVSENDNLFKFLNVLNQFF